MAKGKALCLALKLAQAYHFQNLIIEFDCQVLVNRFSKGAICFAYIDVILADAFLLPYLRIFSRLGGLMCLRM